MPPNRRDPLTSRQVQASGGAVRAPLSRDQLRFVQEYLHDLDPRAAALRAGLDSLAGRTLLAKPQIQTAIQIAKAQRARRTEIYADEVLRSWELARRVDYNEFVSVIVPPCRYCWGTNHHYQFTTLLEMERRGVEHAREQARLPEWGKRDFDTEGGEGYTTLRQPCRGPEWVSLGFDPTADHSCPECHGVGDNPRLLVRDTRYLSQGARYLYEGASRSKDGELKLSLRSRRDFDEMVGRHLGLLGQSARPLAPADPMQMSDEQLDEVLESHGVTVDADYHEVAEVSDDGADGG
jgi:phage terminase small subunit